MGHRYTGLAHSNRVFKKIPLASSIEKFFKISIFLYTRQLLGYHYGIRGFLPHTIYYRKNILLRDVGLWRPKSDVIMVGIDK